MSFPLVLINGVISEEPQDQVGVYPYIHISSGSLIAGGSGFKIYCINGHFIQVFSDGSIYVIWDIVPTSIWDDGVSLWDNDTSIWDVTDVILWDSGTATWDNDAAWWGLADATVWDSAEAEWS